MHITYIHQHFCTPSGSFGTRSYEFALRLIEAGHRVSMICGVGDRTADTFGKIRGVHRFDADGIDVHCIGAKYSNNMGFYRRMRAYGEFAREATRVVSGIDADLVFATSTPLSVGIPGMKAAKRLSAPFVFEVRDLWPELPIQLGMLKNPLLKAYAKRLERKIYFSAKHIVALSPGMKDGICQTGYPREQVTLIPNGCDFNLFRPTQESLQDRRFGEPGSTRFVFAGAHGRANGLDAVLDAARILKERNTIGIQLVFIGLGSERDRLMQRSRDEGTAPFISWLPAIPKRELAEILPCMDVGMMILKNLPAFYYGTSPNKFFDYISCGLPVLNNYPGWVADMIEENDCGVVVPPDDPQAFADAIIRLKESVSARREMGDRSRALAESKFSRDVLAAKFVNVIERIHQQHPRVRRAGAPSGGVVSGTHSPHRRQFQVIGCGGHAKVVIQTIRAAGHEVSRIFDDNPKLWNTRCMDVPVVGPPGELCEQSRLPTVVAIGDNQTREEIVEQYDCDWATIIHPKAIVDPTATIGEGSMVLAGVIVQADANVGRHTILNTAATVDHDTVVDDFCHLCPGVHLAGSVHVGKGVTMGIGSSAIPEASIGDWSTVGAGATVVSDIPPNTTAVGVPAKALEATTGSQSESIDHR